MKRIFSKFSSPSSLLIFNLVFIALALSNIVLFAISYDEERIDFALRIIVPLISVIILFFTLRQAMSANKIQNSLVTYNNEFREIEKLQARGDESQNRHLNAFNKWIELNYNYDISFMNFKEYLLSVSNSLKEIQSTIEDIYQKEGVFKSEEENLRSFYYLYNNFLIYSEDIRRLYDRIKSLHDNNDIVLAHYKLLCRRLYELSNQFFLFSYALLNCKEDSEIFNPRIKKIYDEKYFIKDLFEIEYVKQIYDQIEPLNEFKQNVVS